MDWEDALFSDLSPEDMYRFSSGLFYEIFRSHLEEGLEKSVEFRREHGGHKVALSISVLHPNALTVLTAGAGHSRTCNVRTFQTYRRTVGPWIFCFLDFHQA